MGSGNARADYSAREGAEGEKVLERKKRTIKSGRKKVAIFLTKNLMTHY